MESPAGDVIRYLGPSRHPGTGTVFLNAIRNKRSIVLDLKNPIGRDALLDLARSADVVVYNVRAQAIARLQLNRADFAAVNPTILYVGALGFGQDGPYAARPAFDDVIQADDAVYRFVDELAVRHTNAEWLWPFRNHQHPSEGS